MFKKSLKLTPHNLQKACCLRMWLMVRNWMFLHQEDWNLEVYFFFFWPLWSIFSGKASRADWLYGHESLGKHSDKWHMARQAGSSVSGSGCQIPRHISCSMDVSRSESYHYKIVTLVGAQQEKGLKIGRLPPFLGVLAGMLILLLLRIAVSLSVSLCLCPSKPVKRDFLTSLSPDAC